MRHTTLVRLAAAGLALLAGCSSTRTSFDWDQHYDFSALSTWTWDPSGPGGEPNDLTTRRVSAAIEATLAARGLRRVEADADLRVAWSVSKQDRIRTTGWSGYRGPQRDYWTGYYDERPVEVQQYEEGSLIVDVIDPGQNLLVWRGTATRALGSSVTPAEADAIVQDAVDRLFADFPPSN